MRKPLYIIIPLLFLLFLAKPAAAGIIIRPVINTGLVGYWSFNEGTGTKVGDMSGYGNNGTWAGTGSHWTDGKFGKGGSFNGSDDEVLVSDTNNTLDGVSEVTLSLWFYPRDYNANWRIIAGKGWEARNYGLWQLGEKFVVVIFNGTYRNHPTIKDYAPNQWYHLVMVVDNTNDTVRIYVNGVDDTLNPTETNDMIVNYDEFKITPIDGGYPRVNAIVDEVRVYNRALETSEITKLYKSGLSKIGINQLGLVSADLPANATISYVREDCSGYSPCYNSLFDWEAAWGGFDFADHSCGNGDLTCLNKTAVAKIDGTWNSPDTSAVAIDGWTTDATRYIQIYTTATARHPGKWDETKYRLELMNSDALRITEEYVRIDGLQVKVTSTGSNDDGIRTYASGDPCDIRVSNNIVRGVISGAGNLSFGIASSWVASGTRSLKMWNNIIYDFINSEVANCCSGIYAWSGWRIDAYNNTIYNSAKGISSDGNDFCALKNNLFYNNTDNYAGSFDNYSTNNLSGPSSDAQTPSTNSRNGVQVHFIDEANDDFHLSPADSGARNYGVDLSGSGASVSFSTDIDRQDRKGTWDIGADEARGTIAGGSQANQITNGLVGYWSFNGPDIDGNLAYDRSTGGNNGTIIGATPTDGKVGQGLNFNGTSDYVDMPDSGSIRTNGDFTVSAWVKLDYFPPGLYPTIVSAESADSIEYSWQLRINSFQSFQLAISYNNGGAQWRAATDSANVSYGQWYYVVGTWNNAAGTANLYKNGVQVNTFTDVLGRDDHDEGIEIGWTTDPDNSSWASHWDGLIDEVRIYNRVLEPEEIKRLYNLGR